MTVTDTVSTATRRAHLRSDVALAARVLPTHYPLGTFIAVNPLAGLEAMPFEQAIRRAGDLYGMPATLAPNKFRELYRAGRITDDDLDAAIIRRYPNLPGLPTLQLGAHEVRPVTLLRADLLHGSGQTEHVRRYRTCAEQRDPQAAHTIDTQVGKWCSAYFGHGAWPMPGRQNGFYSAWRALASGDHTLKRAVRQRLREVPARPDDATLAALDMLGVPDEARIAYLQAHLTCLPGWAAHIQWCSGTDAGIDLMAYLAVRLTYECALLGGDQQYRTLDPAPEPTTPTARDRANHLVRFWELAGVTEGELGAAARVLAALPVAARDMLWQNAFEESYRNRLLSTLHVERHESSASAHTQLVTCIDTRSEGLRRHLESLGGYETLGFAGFFAVAIRFTDLLGGAASDLCPVLIAPNYDITEAPSRHGVEYAARHISGALDLAGAESAFHAAKEALAAPFTLAEVAGWVAGPLSTIKTLTPGLAGALRQRLHRWAVPHAPTVLNVDAIPLAERVLYAQVALTTMGLVSGFGRLVVLCGHGSSTENNPYQAALDCGACGGQAGGPNARTAVAILNQPQVREELRSAGIDIPDSTYFVAAQHDTATDRVSILDRHLIPADHADDVDRLEADLGRAGAALAVERCATLPGAPPTLSPQRAARHVAARSTDWAQVYPEWGLAGNAAFIVAPRDVSAGLNLERRAFLHSYDPDVDPDGAALETILTAPLVVAQWINCQYYFSTVAPDVFGAGTKTIHNVVGTAGVLAGHSGDLQLGLPWQSLADGDQLRHEPLRLHAVVQAPLDRIDTIVERNPILQHLFGNDWVGLAARESYGTPWHRWTRNGWQPWFESPSTALTLDEEMIP